MFSQELGVACHRTTRKVVGRTTYLLVGRVIRQGFLPLSNLLHLRRGAILQVFSVSGICKAMLPLRRNPWLWAPGRALVLLDLWSHHSSLWPVLASPLVFFFFFGRACAPRLCQHDNPGWSHLKSPNSSCESLTCPGPDFWDYRHCLWSVTIWTNKGLETRDEPYSTSSTPTDQRNSSHAWPNVGIWHEIFE